MGSADEGYVGDVDNPYHAKAMTGDITPGNPEDARTWADMPKHTGVTSLESKQRQNRLRGSS